MQTILKARYLFYPKTIILGTGLYTIGNFFYDRSEAYVTHRLLERKPFDLKQRYGEQTYAVIAGATSPTGRAFCE